MIRFAYLETKHFVLCWINQNQLFNVYKRIIVGYVNIILFIEDYLNLINSLNLTSGCLVARMSGSGSTCFGLYEKKDEAEKAKKHLLNKFPNAWIKVAKIFS